MLSDVGVLAAGPSNASETLVFLHGWGGSKELWWNVLEDLPDSFRCIALDLPGTGQSSLPPALCTMPAMASWVDETCARLDLSQVTLIGHSLGGNLVAQTTLDFPDRVRRLALVDAALEPSCLPIRAHWPLLPRLGLCALWGMRQASRPLAAAGRRIALAQRANFWQGYARRTHWYLQSNRDDRALQIHLRALIENPLPSSRLAALHQPLLFLHGTRDSVVPVAQARAFANAIPGASLIEFPTSQHCPMDTDSDRFAQALRDFCHSPSP